LPRGQGAMEFLVVAALLTMIAAAMVVPAVRETEASMALSAARTGAFNAALGEKVELTSMDFSQTDGGYQITPRVLVDGKPVAPSDGMRKAMMESMAAALSPSAGADGSNCVSGVFAKYCISG